VEHLGAAEKATAGEKVAAAAAARGMAAAQPTIFVGELRQMNLLMLPTYV